MSNPYQTPNVAPTASIPQSVRPVSITVFGILNLVFSGLGLCGLLMGAASIAMVSAMDASAGPPNPALDIMRESAAYQAYMVVSLGLGFVVTIILAVSGIGLLQSKNWGRLLAIGYGVFAIVSGIVGTIVNWFVVVAPMLAEAKQGPEQAGAIGGAIGGTLGGCIGLIYPVILLFFMFRPNVVAWLTNQTKVQTFA